MYELPAADFIASVTEIKRLVTIMGDDLTGGDEVVDAGIRSRMAPTIDSMRAHLQLVGDQSAWVAANRLHARLMTPEDGITFGQLKRALEDVESRFSDRLQFIRLFVMWGDQLSLLGSGPELLGQPTADRFTSAWFDAEEAAKCLCLQRPTASVFHCMRIVEIGIRALSARLGIPDPVKPAERNWGVILRTIKEKIDTTFPANKRLPGSEGAFLEAILATLDAIKNPWRNEVMHVEGVYTDAEARFILFNTVNFIQKLARGFDEDGRGVDPSLFNE